MYQSVRGYARDDKGRVEMTDNKPVEVDDQVDYATQLERLKHLNLD